MICGEETITCQRKGADDQHTDKQYHCCYKDRDDLRHGCIADHRTTRHAGVVDNCNRNTPPSEGGIECRGKEPRTKEVIHFLRFIGSLLWCENAGDASKINSTERDGKNGRPAETCKLQVAEHICQRELRGAEVKNLKCQQSTNNHHSPRCTAIKAASVSQITE